MSVPSREHWSEVECLVYRVASAHRDAIWLPWTDQLTDGAEESFAQAERWRFFISARKQQAHLLLPAFINSVFREYLIVPPLKACYSRRGAYSLNEPRGCERMARGLFICQ